MPVSIETLEGLPILHGLSATELEEVATHLRVTRHVAGTRMIEEGDPPDHPLYILLSGTVEVVKCGIQRGTHAIGSLTAPSVFGEVEALAHRRAVAGIIASTDIKVATLQRGVLDEMCKSNRPCALKMIRNLATVLAYRLAATDEQLAAQFERAADTQKIDEMRRTLLSGTPGTSEQSL